MFERTDRERGSVSIEVVIITPAILLFLLLVITAGRLAMAKQAVESAAFDAARQVSVVRSTATAENVARDSARSVLSNEGVTCDPAIIIAYTPQTIRPGEKSSVEVAITCVIDLSDVSVPGIPGQVTVRENATSPIDRYREK
jgi:Flp pilus assembly protein TadG